MSRFIKVTTWCDGLDEDPSVYDDKVLLLPASSVKSAIQPSKDGPTWLNVSPETHPYWVEAEVAKRGTCEIGVRETPDEILAMLNGDVEYNKQTISSNRSIGMVKVPQEVVPVGAIARLGNLGFLTVGDLAAKTRKEVSGLLNMGPMMMRFCDAVLDAEGMGWKKP